MVPSFYFSEKISTTCSWTLIILKVNSPKRKKRNIVCLPDFFCWYEIGLETRIAFGWPRLGSTGFEVSTFHHLGGAVLNSEN